jgi:hypothetical protein
MLNTREMPLQADPHRMSDIAMKQTIQIDRDKKYSRRSCVVEMHLVLDVEICAPVANLSSAAELANFKHRMIIAILNRYPPLMAIYKRD